MGSLYLNNNESILLSTHNVVINTIPAEAILTDQRLILIDSRHTQLRPQDIPFNALETVTIGDTSAMDPELSLSLVMNDETRHTLGIVFPQAPKTKRVGERDEWAVKLKEASVNAQREHGVQPAELAPPWVPGELPGEAGEEGKGPEPSDEKFRNPPLSPRKPRAAPSKANRTVIAAGLVVILIIAAVIGVYLFAPSFIGGSGTTATPAPAPEVTATATEVPAVTEQPAAEVTPAPEATPETTAAETVAPASSVPQSGVWIVIEYPGNYTASFGTAGRMRELSGSGNQLYQVPAKNEIVDASVQKGDNSGTVLTVSVYNDGKLVKSGTTTSPHATVEVHADLRVASSTVSNTSTTG
jgi:hypothetical protein